MKLHQPTPAICLFPLVKTRKEKRTKTKERRNNDEHGGRGDRARTNQRTASSAPFVYFVPSVFTAGLARTPAEKEIIRKTAAQIRTFTEHPAALALLASGPCRPNGNQCAVAANPGSQRIATASPSTGRSAQGRIVIAAPKPNASAIRFTVTACFDGAGEELRKPRLRTGRNREW